MKLGNKKDFFKIHRTLFTKTYNEIELISV